MTIGRVKALRGLALVGAFGSMVVLLMYAMGPPGQFESVTLTAGSGVLAGFAVFFATFVFGPLAYPRRTSEGFLALAIFAFLAVGVVVVLSAAVRTLFAGIAGAA